MSVENLVFRKIKEMSLRVPNPRPQISIHHLAAELLLFKEQILPAITELQSLRLIQHNSPNNDTEYVKLTLLGFTVTR